VEHQNANWSATSKIRPALERRPLPCFRSRLPHGLHGVAIPYGIMTSPKTVALLSWAFPTTTPHSPLTPLPTGVPGRFQRYSGSRRILILADTGGSNGYRCYAWKTELQSNWPTLLPCLSPGPLSTWRFQMESHRASSFFRRCHETGLGEPLDSYQKILNYTRTTKTQKPALPSLLTWIAATIPCGPSQLPTNSPHCDCSAMKPCPSGTTPSNLNCEVVLERRLRGLTVREDSSKPIMPAAAMSSPQKS